MQDFLTFVETLWDVCVLQITEADCDSIYFTVSAYQKLGAGVFGEVFLAKGVFRKPGEITVAIKRLHIDADQESKDLLALEYQLLQQVRHRCIVRVWYFPQRKCCGDGVHQGVNCEK